MKNEIGLLVCWWLGAVVVALHSAYSTEWLLELLILLVERRQVPNSRGLPKRSQLANTISCLFTRSLTGKHLS